MAGLTRAERKLRSEIEAISSAIEMDVWNIDQYKRGPGRAYTLMVMKDRLVRAEVIFRYTLVDEFLTDIICDFYFRRPNKRVGYGALWKTKRFKIFVHYLMDETFLLKKLAMVEAIMTVPKSVSSAIKRINDVRNALAHSFFPENRRRYMADKQVKYRNAPLFTIDGITAFQDDYETARSHFTKRVFG
jgi:hypothetical protein